MSNIHIPRSFVICSGYSAENQPKKNLVSILFSSPGIPRPPKFPTGRSELPLAQAFQDKVTYYASYGNCLDSRWPGEKRGISDIIAPQPLVRLRDGPGQRAWAQVSDRCVRHLNNTFLPARGGWVSLVRVPSLERGQENGPSTIHSSTYSIVSRMPQALFIGPKRPGKAAKYL